MGIDSRTPGEELTPEDKNIKRLDLSLVSEAVTCILKQELQFQSDGQTVIIKPDTSITILEAEDYKQFKIYTDDGNKMTTYTVNKRDLPPDILVSEVLSG